MNIIHVYIIPIDNVELYLQHYTKTGIVLCEDVIMNIGARMFISPRLVFLVKYSDFHGYHQQKHYAQAAELLINLLDSKIAPSYFWPTMFADTFSLLESSDPVFSTKETHKIMHHLENNLIPLLDKLRKQIKNATYQTIDDNEIAEWEPLVRKSAATQNGTAEISLVEKIAEVVQVLRSSCIRNLSRAIILENTAFQ